VAKPLKGEDVKISKRCLGRIVLPYLQNKKKNKSTPFFVGNVIFFGVQESQSVCFLCACKSGCIRLGTSCKTQSVAKLERGRGINMLASNGGHA